MNVNAYSFKSAVPVWEVGTSTLMNRTVAFCADVAEGEKITLAAAASCSFLLLVNGEFFALKMGYRCINEFIEVMRKYL